MSDPTKKVLLSIGDGPDGIEIYTSEEEAIVDWAHDIPALYLKVSCGMIAAAQFGPFTLSKSLIAQLEPLLRAEQPASPAPRPPVHETSQQGFAVAAGEATQSRNSGEAAESTNPEPKPKEAAPVRPPAPPSESLAYEMATAILWAEAHIHGFAKKRADLVRSAKGYLEATNHANSIGNQPDTDLPSDPGKTVDGDELLADQCIEAADYLRSLKSGEAGSYRRGLERAAQIAEDDNNAHRSPDLAAAIREEAAK